MTLWNLYLVHWGGIKPEVGEVFVDVPPQNGNVISFHANADGKIELVGHQHYDGLRADDDSLDRYDECMNLARDVLHRCEGSNAASRLVSMLQNYLNAAGESPSELRPSLLVQRGERLRQEISAYQMHDTMLAPLSDDILLDLRAWQGAHNMLVGLDPVLMARDTALFGPEDRIADVSPSEIRDIASDAERSGLLGEEVIDVVIEATNLAPEIPDPRNRRTIWSFETGRNLVIEAFNVALRNPGKSVVGALVSGAAVTSLGLAGTVVSVAAGALPAAKFLLRHKDWIETRLGDTPTWHGLFVSLSDWLEKNTPVEPPN